MQYSELLERVALDLGNRQDLLAPVPPSTVAVIPSKVQGRIRYYQKALFSPSNQLDYSITTIRAQSIYKIPKGNQSIAGIRLLLGNIWLRLSWRRYDVILNMDAINPPFITLPSLYAQRGLTFRLFPTPDRAYPLELLVNDSPPPPVDATDENFWTDEGPQGASTLIIAAACADICRRPLNDQAKAAAFDGVVARETLSLMEQDQRLAGPMFVVGYL